MVISRNDRARQFLPFDALKGFQEALREKEIEYEEKIELSEESYGELSRQFNKLEKGSKVMLTCYNKNRYIKIGGHVREIQYEKRKILLDSEVKINFDDILKIDIE